MVSNMEYNKALRNGKLSNGFLNNYTFVIRMLTKFIFFPLFFILF